MKKAIFAAIACTIVIAACSTSQHRKVADADITICHHVPVRGAVIRRQLVIQPAALQVHLSHGDDMDLDTCPIGN